ncbi:MAG: hypothetical protein CM1200mP20_04130 [Pseudomonadota bacterium]|nr:MAG: hypothetical protein CM1200mP20_04130 [Pseudomonadota bacterium]
MHSAPAAVGLLDEPRVPVSLMVLVVILLATVTFDGLLETPLWAHVLERTLTGEVRYVGSAALIMCSAVFLTVFLASSWLMAYCARRFGGSRSAGTGTGPDVFETAGSFVMTLVPIAIAYHLAHYLSYLVISGQYLIPRLSDPLGKGWNLLGTSDYQVDIGLLGARAAWYLAVAFILAGHVFCCLHRTPCSVAVVWSLARSFLQPDSNDGVDGALHHVQSVDTRSTDGVLTQVSKVNRR